MTAEFNCNNANEFSDLNRERIGTDGQRESVSTASAGGASVILDLLFEILTLFSIPISIVSITINITIIAKAIISIGILSMSIVSINTMPMAIVAVPVSICNVIVNEGAIFIFTELAGKFRLQC